MIFLFKNLKKENLGISLWVQVLKILKIVVLIIIVSLIHFVYVFISIQHEKFNSTAIQLLYLMRVIFNLCWFSTPNTYILCRLRIVKRNTWNVYTLFNTKSNRCTWLISTLKSIRILCYFWSSNFTYTFPQHNFLCWYYGLHSSGSG
jgi:uncharacterized membrane protein